MNNEIKLSRRQKEHLKEGLAEYVTESLNPRSVDIDLKSTKDILHIINEEDKTVAHVVEQEIPHIAQAVDMIVAAFRKNGRLFYAGPGTDGRMGVVDAAECPPTYGTDPDMVQAIMAGGPEAVFRAREWVEDEGETGGSALMDRKPNPQDIIVGISCDARADFVIEALNKAKELGMKAIAFTNNPDTILHKIADIIINPVVGPEVILGSTRMKVGICQKMVLTMLSTAAMVKLGKTYSNLMINIKPRNNKLIERAKRIVMIITHANYEQAEEALKKADWDIKIAVIMLKKNKTKAESESLLRKTDGNLRTAIEKCV